MPDAGLVASFEKIRKQAVEQVLTAYEDALDAKGDRPWGFTQADPEDLLEHFLSISAQPGGWDEVIAQESQSFGRDAAEQRLMKAASKMTRMLVRRGTNFTMTNAGIADLSDAEYQRAVLAGAESVQAVQLSKRLNHAARVLDKADRIDALPKARTYEVPRPPQLEQLIGMGGTQ